VTNDDHFPEIDGPRIFRVDRRGRDPGAVRADVRVPGVQDPDRVDEAEPAGRRSPAGQQVHLRAGRQRRRAGAAADAPDRARRHHRLQVSGGSGARFHQAGHRPARRNARAEEQDGLHQRHGAGGAVRPLPVSGLGAWRRRLHRLRRPPQLRAGDGARRLLLHDGRQPRQLAGQPVLGVHAAVVARRCSSTSRSATPPPDWRIRCGGGGCCTRSTKTGA
jgi:hypothetical protein